jgi:hypothetical protein
MDGNHMDELVAQVAANAGVEPAVARRAVAIILKFLLSEGAGAKVQELVDALPGAGDAVASVPEVRGGVMGAFNALTAAGLGMGDIQEVTREFVAYAKSKIGAQAVDEVIGSIPGLSQFV